MKWESVFWIARAKHRPKRNAVLRKWWYLQEFKQKQFSSVKSLTPRGKGNFDPLIIPFPIFPASFLSSSIVKHANRPKPPWILVRSSKSTI